MIKAPESSGQTRKEFAVAAVNMMKDHPVTGVGINNWGIKINPPYPYSKHREDRHYKEDYKDGIVETIYLLVAAECGWWGLGTLILWFLYYYLSNGISMFVLRKKPCDGFVIGLFGGLTCNYWHSTLEWSLKQTNNFAGQMILYALIGVIAIHRKSIVAAYRRSQENQKNTGVSGAGRGPSYAYPPELPAGGSPPALPPPRIPSGIPEKA